MGIEPLKFLYLSWTEVQLSDAKDVLKEIKPITGVKFPVLTPNLKVSCYFASWNLLAGSIVIWNLFWFLRQGFEAAVEAGAKEVAVFAAASESFSRSNINCSIEDSLRRYHDVALAARNLSIPVRGYVLHFDRFIILAIGMP